MRWLADRKGRLSLEKHKVTMQYMAGGVKEERDPVAHAQRSMKVAGRVDVMCGRVFTVHAL